MKPLRRKKNIEVTQDADGVERILEITDQEDVLTGQDSLDSRIVRQRFFLDCGCTNAEIGGKCLDGDCSAISCVDCHGRCHRCQIPLCLEHSRYLTTDESETLRLCRRCFENTKRKHKWVRTGKLLLSIFVENKSNG